MSNKIIRVFATIIFALMPFLVLSEKIETQISADTITIQRSGILNAEGNVVVRYGTNKIKDRALKFNQKSNQIEFIWNGQTEYGNNVQNGIYFCRLSDNGEYSWVKVAVLSEP